MTPTSGPHSRPAPPSSAMITTWNDSIGVKAMRGLDVDVARRQDRAGHRGTGAGIMNSSTLARAVLMPHGGHRLVVADDAQREAQPRPADQPAARNTSAASPAAASRCGASVMSVST
jgi:hypothetical protein